MNAVFDLNGKKSIVTGAGRGIGRALAMGLAKAGSDVTIVARTESDLLSLKKEIENLGRNCHLIVADVTNQSERERIVQETLEHLGGLHILINNAGFNIRTKALEVTEEDWDRVTDLDLKSVFFMAQAAGKVMCEQGYGRIINISSVAGQIALRTGVAYGASKGGINQMTKTLALEWAKYGVTVNGIAPWYFRTALTDKLLADEAYYNEIVGRTPMQRVGDVKELVGPALLFASDASSYITGQTLTVDGGMSIFGF